MAIGKGKYDEYCTALFIATQARLTAVMVLGGVRGEGFSVTTHDPQLVARLPAMLRDMADQIEQDVHTMKGGKTDGPEEFDSRPA